jgi:L-alanine-DL-glutamate epimerase-like enolase superfamily enzyme
MAIREAVGPEIKLAMDGNLRMTLPQAELLCKLTEDDVRISFLEEPMLENDVHLMRQLRSRTSIPIAAAINNRNTARDLLVNEAVDILQPNCCNDGGYTAALHVASMARGFNVPLGHGNGHGPHNLPLQAGLANGSIIELHYHNWSAYKAIYQEVPEIVDGRMKAMTEPGTGLVPKPEVLEEYAA